MHTINQHNDASLSRHAVIAAELSACANIPVASRVAMEVAQLVARWSHRASSRKALASLDAYMLKDIGLTREEALQEAEKPFWR